MMVQTSDDGVLTWNDPVLIVEEVEGDDLHDKNSISADPTRPGHAYAVRDFIDLPTGAAINPDRGVFGGGLGFKGAALIPRTTDGGQTWSQPQRLYNPGGIHRQPDRGAPGRHTDRLLRRDPELRNNDQDDQFDLNLSFKRSPDAGRPGGRPGAVPLRRDRCRTDLRSGHRRVPPDGRGALRRRSGPRNGALYVVWQDARFATPSQVAFTMSIDGWGHLDRAGADQQDATGHRQPAERAGLHPSRPRRR